MKKSIFVLTLVMVCALGFSSCSDDSKFNYPMEMVYGTWKSSAIKQADGTWKVITSPVYADLWFSIKFNADGTYYGDGYFGTGTGTYKAEKNMIYTYVDGKEYARYTVISMSHTEAELTMSMDGESMDIRVEKKK